MTVTGRSNGLAFDFVYESLRLTGRLIIQTSTYAFASPIGLLTFNRASAAISRATALPTHSYTPVNDQSSTRCGHWFSLR